MPKSRYDLRRIRKIYPVKRRSPLFANTGGDLEEFKIPFNNSQSETYDLTEAYNTAPVVVVSVQGDDVNVYVANITGSPSAGFTIEVKTSHNFTGTVHGFAGDPST
tara:strand:+ start:428 stop:745 length:318 start_codon:yes stop_codon:yes gene_type:complete